MFWRKAAVLAALASVTIGWAACLMEVETIVGSWICVAITGAILIGYGLRVNRWAVLGLGITHLGLCALIFLLIVTLQWSPNEAQFPVSAMATGYLFTSLFFYSRAWHALV